MATMTQCLDKLRYEGRLSDHSYRDILEEAKRQSLGEPESTAFWANFALLDGHRHRIFRPETAQAIARDIDEFVALLRQPKACAIFRKLNR